MKLRKIICLLLLSVILFGLCSCSLKDPTIAIEEETTKVNKGDTTERTIPDYIDIDKFANCSFELSYLLKQSNFNSPDEMSVSALVQYCFCHLYYERLVDMPTQGINERVCTYDQMKTSVIKQFGTVTSDLKKADTWNAVNDRFEMWEPLYGMSIYYDTEAQAMASDQYRIITTFYFDEEKAEPVFRTQMTVNGNNGSPTIASLKTIELSKTESK